MSITPGTEATFEDIVLKAGKPGVLALGAPWRRTARRPSGLRKTIN